MTKLQERQIRARVKELEANNASLSGDITRLEAHVADLYSDLMFRKAYIRQLEGAPKGTDTFKNDVRRELLPRGDRRK